MNMKDFDDAMEHNRKRMEEPFHMKYHEETIERIRKFMEEPSYMKYHEETIERIRKFMEEPSYMKYHEEAIERNRKFMEENSLTYSYSYDFAKNNCLGKNLSNIGQELLKSYDDDYDNYDDDYQNQKAICWRGSYPDGIQKLQKALKEAESKEDVMIKSMENKIILESKEQYLLVFSTNAIASDTLRKIAQSMEQAFHRKEAPEKLTEELQKAMEVSNVNPLSVSIIYRNLNI